MHMLTCRTCPVFAALCPDVLAESRGAMKWQSKPTAAGYVSELHSTGRTEVSLYGV